MQAPPPPNVPLVKISTDSRRGARDYMEDFIDVIEVPDARIFIIACDGHGGRRAAEFAIKAICARVARFAPDQWDLGRVITDVSNAWDRECLSRLGVKKAPQTVEERAEMFNALKRDRKAYDAYMSEEWHSGTTVVCALLDVIAHRGVIANLGDSRCVWKDYSAAKKRLAATRDHDPSQKDLGSLGGVVVKTEGDVARINGDLAVGRALGDNSDLLMGSVSHVPYVSDMFMWGTAAAGCTLTLVVATDGVWDVVKNPEALSEKKAAEASTLVDLALARKSTDNVTAGVIRISYPTPPPPIQVTHRHSSSDASTPAPEPAPAPPKPRRRTKAQ